MKNILFINLITEVFQVFYGRTVIKQRMRQLCMRLTAAQIFTKHGMDGACCFEEPERSHHTETSAGTSTQRKWTDGIMKLFFRKQLAMTGDENCRIYTDGETEHYE